MEFVVLKCPYCGGKLESKDDHFVCLNCGNNVIMRPKVHPTDGSGRTGPGRSRGDPCTLHIEHDGGEFEFEFTGSAIVEVGYRRRVTMADPFPMTMSVDVDGRKITILGEMPDIGRGRVTIESERGRIHATKDGEVSVRLNGSPCGSRIDLVPGDVLTVGGVNMKVKLKTIGFEILDDTFGIERRGGA